MGRPPLEPAHSFWPKHSFWNILGQAEAPKFGSGSLAGPVAADLEDAFRLPPKEAASGLAKEREARVNPRKHPESAIAELIGILGEANRIAARCRMLFSKVRESAGLSGIEVLTLIAIAHARTPPTVPQVGRSLGHPRQVIQRAVKVLERDGLVSAQPNPDHKRAQRLAATAKGKRLGESIDAAAQDIVSGLAGGSDLETLGVTHAGLLELREQIDRMAGFGMD